MTLTRPTVAPEPLTRRNQHERFISSLGTKTRYALAFRYEDAGAAVPFDRAARRRRNRAARKARRRNRA